MATPCDAAEGDAGKAEAKKLGATDTIYDAQENPSTQVSQCRSALASSRELRDEGVTLIFVSHFLEDVLALSDTVTVLKDGRHVKTSPASGETPESLVTSMLGRSMDVAFPSRVQPPSESPVVLRVTGLTHRPHVNDVSLELRAGEIVGLAGLVGSGRTQMVRPVFGADRARGVVEVDGGTISPCSPRRSIKHGLALLPESRKERGLAMHRPVFENVTMAHLEEISRAGILRKPHERELVAGVLRRVDVRAASTKMEVSGLSGGNQQKVALSKWLVRPPRVLIADEPTRGVDVGAKRAIYELITRLAVEGVAVLIISSELEEVIGLAHRILVIRRGAIVAEFVGDQIEEEAVLNCGINARYMIAALGLSRLVTSPIRNSFQFGSRGSSRVSNRPLPPGLSACQARNPRYRAGGLEPDVEPGDRHEDDSQADVGHRHVEDEADKGAGQRHQPGPPPLTDTAGNEVHHVRAWRQDHPECRKRHTYRGCHPDRHRARFRSVG